MPHGYGVDVASFNGFLPVNMRSPLLIAMGFTKRLSSSMRLCSIRDATNVAPP